MVDGKNKEYTKARDKLIPIAEKFANEKRGTSQGPGEEISEWAAEWNLIFINKMQELATGLGLVGISEEGPGKGRGYHEKD